MALKLIANYSKRLGLPGYSSHQFSVCVETEINSNDDIQGESTRLYQTLQQSVDEEIQHTGFVPGEAYGGRTNSMAQTKGPKLTNGNNGQWQCSDKQRDLILQVIQEHGLDKEEIEELARQRFGGKTVKQLNKLEASGLIDELFERTGQQSGRDRRPRQNSAPAYRNGASR